MTSIITNINNVVNSFVWGPFGVALLLSAGIVLTLVNRGFQFRHIGLWLKKTLGAVFVDKNITAHTTKGNKAISQFQSMCTALSATVGTGNIVGVAAAIIFGGPGSIFWMWIIAFLGMMTHYSETILGIFYRRKTEEGEWRGGAMYYLRDGLGSYKGMKHVGKVLAVFFCIFTLLASFGIGNMTQANSIAGNMESAFSVPTWVSGVILSIIIAIVSFGGIKCVATVAEKMAPFMALLYLFGSLAVIFAHIENIGAVFAAIFEGAFGLRAAGGGAIGYGFYRAVSWGFRRGAFSNEAGLGSSVMIHSSSNVKEPVQQGMWAILEVFVDTNVICTMTALVVLSSGVVDLHTGEILSGKSGAGLVGEAFATLFGSFGPKFIAIAILLFTFSTLLCWSHYGVTAWHYLFGQKTQIIYKLVFAPIVYIGCTMSLSLAWNLSDTFNGLMMIPNIIGVLSLSPLVGKITKNYLDRNIHKKDVPPLLSAMESSEEKPSNCDISEHQNGEVK